MTIQTKELRTKRQETNKLDRRHELAMVKKIDRESPRRMQYRNRVQKGTESLTWGTQQTIHGTETGHKFAPAGRKKDYI